MKEQTYKILYHLEKLLQKEVVDWDAVEQTVRKFPDVNEYDEGDTPLTEALYWCGIGSNMLKLIRLFMENGYDLSANGGENGAEVLAGLCWSTYDEGVTDAAKYLLELGADPQITYKENGEIDYESGVYGAIDWKLMGLWAQGYYDTANIFEAFRQIIDAYKDGKDYHRIGCFSDCCGHTLRKVEYLPDDDTRGTPSETYPGYDGRLVFWFDELPLVVRRYIDFAVNPFSVEDTEEPLTDISARFSGIIGATLEKFVFIDTHTVKMCFRDGVVLLLTAERINENVMLSFCELCREQPFPDLTGLEVDRVVFLRGKVYAPGCTSFTEESVGLLCGDRAFLLWSETDGGDYDDHWFGCLACSPEFLSHRRRYLELPHMRVERLFRHNYHKTGMRLSCGGKYFYLATNYFHEITLSLTDERINSHKALFAFDGSEHLSFLLNGEEIVPSPNMERQRSTDMSEFYELKHCPCCGVRPIVGDAEAALAGELEGLWIRDDEGFWQGTPASCDCNAVLLKSKDRDDYFWIETQDSQLKIVTVPEAVNASALCRKLALPECGAVLQNIRFEDGQPEALKYRCGDRYLFVTACEDWLIVSLMLFDFFEEDDTPIPDFDDSELEFGES